jgi:hypothetical protein
MKTWRPESGSSWMVGRSDSSGAAGEGIGKSGGSDLVVPEAEWLVERSNQPPYTPFLVGMA